MIYLELLGYALLVMGGFVSEASFGDGFDFVSNVWRRAFDYGLLR